MKNLTKAAAFFTAATILFGAMTVPGSSASSDAAAESANIESQMKIGTMGIAGGGFVSGIVTGKTTMYARTDVGGAYKYNYDTGNWDQLMDFINENDRGYLSIDAMCIDPTNEDNVYMLAGCAYFSDARTAVFISHDGCKTFKEVDVTDMIQVMGNGDGRQCGESIAVDPDNPNIIYCGGDVASGDSALIMSEDGGDTWKSVKGYDDLGLYKNTVKWPTWTDHIVRCMTEGEYNNHNGVASIQISEGKVYVASSVTGVTNIHVADVGKDNFEELSADLPTENFPTRINLDADGNLLITYISGLAFQGATGSGAYKYNPKTGTVTDISPTKNGYGAVFSDPDDANKLVATTCGLWYSQMWQAWSDDQGPAWGDRFFKSTDGGQTWISMTPGNTTSWGGPLEAEYLNDGGRAWIRNKAIHWTGAIVLDPNDKNRIVVTSGNGVFACDNTWDECPQFYFEADGIEEVVALDMVSPKGANPYSAIGDYDGFEHISKTESIQHQPNMGSTSAIAYCPSNPLVMVRASQNDATTYYTLDGGKTWTKMDAQSTGGKAAITELEDGTYRIFRTGNGKGEYTDDFGATWKSCTGIDGSRELCFKVDENNPKYVYGYTAKYNEYWFYDTTKKEPTFEDAHYIFMVSDDYGATFKAQDICKYDQCDVANRIGYLSEGEMVLGAGWNGAYHVTDFGKSIEKLDSVFYCKSIGFGAPEKEGGVNTLYMYGQPTESDPQGIYRSTDAGKSWVAININKLYGGTGNGNFLVGDMNEFGTVYMSTVGCGIVYMQLDKNTDPDIKTTTTTTATTTTTDDTTTTADTTTVSSNSTTTTGKTTTSTTKTTLSTGKTTTSTTKTTLSSIKTTTQTTLSTKKTTETTTNNITDALYGDTNLDKSVSVVDLVYLNKYIVNIIKFNDQQKLNADCFYDNGIDSNDASALLNYLAEKIDSLPVTE